PFLFVPVFFASGVSCPRPYAQRMATARCVEKWQSWADNVVRREAVFVGDEIITAL
ncbi:hypothetical protein HMPREF9602_01262, partial [Cutibacterium acnes HL030PA2]